MKQEAWNFFKVSSFKFQVSRNYGRKRKIYENKTSS